MAAAGILAVADKATQQLWIFKKESIGGVEELCRLGIDLSTCLEKAY